MNIRLILVYTLYFSTSLLSAQVFFERLLTPEIVDTSFLALDIISDETGQFFYLLSNASFYDPSNTSGTPIEGTFTYGSSITKVSSQGEVIWRSIYPTNCGNNCDGSLELLGRIPTKKILLNDNAVIMPYSQYKGLLVCQTTPLGQLATTSYYSNLTKISQESGLSIQVNSQNIFNDTCRKDRIVEIASVNDKYGVIVHDAYYENLYYVEYNDLLEEEVIINLEDNRIAYIDYLVGNFIAFTNDEIVFYDRNEAPIDSLSLSIEEELIGVRRTVFQNDEFLGFLITGRQSITEEYISFLIVVDRELEIIAQQFFDNTYIVDASFTNNGIIYLQSLQNNSGDLNTPSYKVGLLDNSLTLLNSKNYGYEYSYTLPEKITVNEQGGFTVIGTSFTSTLNNNNRRANQLYILSSSIDDLVYTVENNEKENFVNIFPNPVNDRFKITHAKNPGVRYSIYVYDIKGILMSYHDDNFGDTSYIDISKLPDGFYYLLLQYENGTHAIEKIIK